MERERECWIKEDPEKMVGPRELWNIFKDIKISKTCCFLETNQTTPWHRQNTL